jgi:predicted homoserine dehydrogenase-like protein
MAMWKRMERHASRNGDARIAVIGAGYVGEGIVNQLKRAPGMFPSLIVNRTVDRAVDAYATAGYDRSQIVISDKADELADAIMAGIPAITESADVVPELPVDIVVEATGALSYGAEVIIAALEAGKDVVSFNAEVDGLLAYLFHDKARSNNAIYTIADGDQPGVILRHMEQVEGMGFKVTAALNCKRHLDVHQTPSSGADYASRDATSSIMTTAFGDGTKMQVEQVCVANATGMVPDKRGMHGIQTTLEEAAADIPAALSGPGKVDFTHQGDFGAGVGVIGRHETPELVEKSMRFYKMGDGPDYFFFRPYHLVHLELPMTIADIVLDREPLATVDAPHVAEVVAMAKKDLAAGERLDCIGGFTVYGLADTMEGADGLLPVGLVNYATMVNDVAQDAAIALADVQLDEDEPLVKRWRELKAIS